MKRKCDKCQGKGGWVCSRGRFTYYQTCVQCRGAGKWYTNERPKHPSRDKR